MLIMYQVQVLYWINVFIYECSTTFHTLLRNLYCIRGLYISLPFKACFWQWPTCSYNMLFNVQYCIYLPAR
jgi:hypothetical protein